MILSMTGYGRANQILGGRDITVEIRSVNSRFFEYSSRMSRSVVFLDDKLKKLLMSRISRGKVELALTIQNIDAPDTTIVANTEVARQYVQAVEEMCSELDLQNDLTVTGIMRLPEIFTTRREKQDEEALWVDIKTVAEQALQNFIMMRAAEGEKLCTDILSRLQTIENTVTEIETNSADRVSRYTEKLYKKLETLLADKNVDEARVLTEAAIFADKTAVDEETVRLKSHIAQYRSILQTDSPIGKKLDFLTQELNRETNTIGSKCNEITVTRMVVDMKGEVEKIREQVQNIE